MCIYWVLLPCLGIYGTKMKDREVHTCHLFVQVTALLFTRNLWFFWLLLAVTSPHPQPPPHSWEGLYSQVPQAAAPLEPLNARVAVPVTGVGRAELECFQSFSLKEFALLDLSAGSQEDMLIRLYLTWLRACVLNTKSLLLGGCVKNSHRETF